jgi:hypothetical protein
MTEIIDIIVMPFVSWSILKTDVQKHCVRLLLQPAIWMWKWSYGMGSAIFISYKTICSQLGKVVASGKHELMN